MEVQIEKLVYGGHGLARADGRVVLVPFVAPGETLTVRAVKERRDLVEAVPVAWREKAAFRIDPECPVFGRCGGCNYQHLPYPQQLEYKRQILRETLARVGKVPWDGTIETVAAEPWGYRNRTQLHLAKRGNHASLGFLMAGSRRLVPTESCPINSPTLNRAHKALAEMTRERRFPNFLDEIELFTNERDIQMNVLSVERRPARQFFDWCAETIEGFAPGDSIDYPSGGDLFQVSGRCFFQVNRFLTEKLAQIIASDASGEVALDLYAGVGLFTLPLARRFARVVAVDSSARAVRSLQYNAERAGLSVRVVHMDVEAFLPSFREQADSIVADPPRAGLGRRVTEELIRIKPRRLVLVSCDPATLARDLRPLLDGGYEIHKITLVDLFPQTFHLETVVDLSPS